MTGGLYGLAGLLGLAVGSFLNVVVHRVPQGLSVVRPRSACPGCDAPIRSWDNIPVVSWMILRGRCRDCGEPISVRYPLIELGTALVFIAVVAWFTAVVDQPWAVPAYLYLAAISVALALIDAATHRLPNAIVLPSYAVLGALLLMATWGSGDWSSGLRALIGGAGLWVLYFLLLVIKPGGMGFGDVKLAGLLGACLGWIGWGALAVGAFGAFVVGGLYSISLLLTRRAGRGSAIPFGPWMILGAAIGIAVGERAWAAYLDLLG